MRDVCPKCSTPTSGDACPKCGLVFSKFDPAVLDEEVPEPLKQLWQTVEEDWDDRAHHALFVERALAAGHLGFAALCYRQKAGDATARAQLDTIEERLQQVMAATQTERVGGNPRRGLAIGMLLLFFVVLLITMAYGLHLIPK